MKKIQSLDDFGINESVVGKYTTMSADEMSLVKKCTSADFGKDDTPKRAAIIKAIEAASTYFDESDGNGLDAKSKIISASADDALRDKLFNLARTFVTSLEKIRTVEINEIEPVTTQIKTALQ